MDKKPFRLGAQRVPDTGVSEDVTFSDCVQQAEICCEQARLAGRQRRFKAACGLFSTAAALYKRASLLDGVSYLALEQRLSDIEAEMATYSELAKSMARPLLGQTLTRNPHEESRPATDHKL